MSTESTPRPDDAAELRHIIAVLNATPGCAGAGESLYTGAKLNKMSVHVRVHGTHIRRSGSGLLDTKLKMAHSLRSTVEEIVGEEIVAAAEEQMMNPVGSAAGSGSSSGGGSSGFAPMETGRLTGLKRAAELRLEQLDQEQKRAREAFEAEQQVARGAALRQRRLRPPPQLLLSPDSRRSRGLPLFLLLSPLLSSPSPLPPILSSPTLSSPTLRALPFCVSG